MKAYRWYGYLFGSTASEVTAYIPSRLTSIRPKQRGILLRIWNIAAFYYLQFAPKTSEKFEMKTLNNDKSSLEAVVKSIEHDTDGLHNINVRSNFPPGNLSNESYEVGKELSSRINLLTSDGKVVTPLSKEILQNLGN